jgi:dihydrofolate reductase
MNMIVAVNKHGIIGKYKDMIWHIPEDMKHFRRETMHNIVLMGRKTYDSLPNGPLDSRTNIVITSKPENYKNNARSSTIFCDLDECDDILCKLQANTNTPLNIYNGTPEGVPPDVQGQPLPINQLKGNPPMEDCSISNGHRCKRIFVIGGAQIYTHFFKRCKTIYVTLVQNDELDGVSIYPLLEEMQTNYKIVSRTQKNDKPMQAAQTAQKSPTIDYEFIVYESPA